MFTSQMKEMALPDGGCEQGISPGSEKCCCVLFSAAGKVDVKIKSPNNKTKSKGESLLSHHGGASRWGPRCTGAPGSICALGKVAQASGSSQKRRGGRGWDPYFVFAMPLPLNTMLVPGLRSSQGYQRQE